VDAIFVGCFQDLRFGVVEPSRINLQAPHQSLHHGAQFFQTNGFSQVVIGALSIAFDAILTGIFGGEQHHATALPLLPQLRYQLQAITIGQHPV